MRFAVLVALACLPGACSGGGHSPLEGDAFVEGLDCTPFFDSCGTGRKCGWVVDRIDPPSGHRQCVADGNVGTEGPCAYGVDGLGASNCAAGSECVDGVCHQVCNFGGLESPPPRCDNINTTCSYTVDVLLGDNFFWYAGVCQPTCNPLTQERWDGAPACGSPDPTNPTIACMLATPIRDKFVCMTLEPGAGARTDGQLAIVRGGSPEDRGCAAGYIPTFMGFATCAGLCAPLRTDNTQPQNAVGDSSVAVKLPASPTPRAGDGICVPGKKGSTNSEDCRFYQNTTVGYCLDYQRFGVPSCAQLSPAQAQASGCYPQ